MEPNPIIFSRIDAPLPEKAKAGRPSEQRDIMFDLLGTMEVGGSAIDVNRSKRSVQGYVQRFRAHVEEGARYVLRSQATGWTRIWRTA